MRKALYRGRCIGGDSVYGWVYGYYVCLKDPVKGHETHRIYTEFTNYCCGVFFEDNWREVDPETISQFTGLSDKNGTKIYEGDIVKYKSVPMLVVWDNQSASFIVRYSVNGCCYENTLDGHLNLEVIGNIHDNPGLLEGTT